MLFLSLLALSIKICLAESAASLLHLPTILPRRYTLPALEGADEIVQAGKTGVQRDLRQALIRGNDFMGGGLRGLFLHPERGGDLDRAPLLVQRHGDL